MKVFFSFINGEIYKLLRSRPFQMVVGILIALVLADGVLARQDYIDNLRDSYASIALMEDGNFSQYPFLQIYTLYNSWIGGRPNQTLPVIFFTTMPIFAVIPYSWSCLSEYKSGYLHTMAARVGRMPYFIGKYISAFLSGALAVSIPMLISLIFTACLVPAYKPDISFVLYYQVRETNLFSALYYGHPLAAALANILLASLFAGLWATVPYAVSFFVHNRLAALFAPYLVLLFATASAEQALVFRSYTAVSIFDYIQLPSPSGTQSPAVLAGELLALFLIPLGITIAKGVQKDVL